MLLRSTAMPFRGGSGRAECAGLASRRSAGIPVTHRDCCVVACTSSPRTRAQAGRSKLTLTSLVRLDGTLVFLMGLSALRTGDGWTADRRHRSQICPRAVIENGARGTQRKVVATPLLALRTRVRAAGLATAQRSSWSGRVCRTAAMRSTGSRPAAARQDHRRDSTARRGRGRSPGGCARWGRRSSKRRASRPVERHGHAAAGG